MPKKCVALCQKQWGEQKEGNNAATRRCLASIPLQNASQYRPGTRVNTAARRDQLLPEAGPERIAQPKFEIWFFIIDAHFKAAKRKFSSGNNASFPAEIANMRYKAEITHNK